jgi:glucose-6-phosphate isomerase
MHFSYFDSTVITEKAITSDVQKLSIYRQKVRRVITEHDNTSSEYSLIHAQDQSVHDTIDELKKRFKGIQHVVLVGIGGSNLGTEAVHTTLDTNTVTLHTLDTVSAHAIELLLQKLQGVRSVKKIAVCVISKSGNTAETLVNASVLLEALEVMFAKNIYEQTVFIGDAGTEFMKKGKRLGVTTITMPKIVGGRYSVATEVGLIPLALLGHDTDAFITGVLDATSEEFESEVANSAARLHQYILKGYRQYNFFAFEPRLATLGAWYRQLFAESIGKEKDRSGKMVTKGFLPTISTPTELHSVGQLYLSGFTGVYTDFVTFDDDTIDYQVSKKGIAKQYGTFTVAEVAAAIYGGVVAAYQEQMLPYRSTIFTEDLPYSLGLFMGMRMLETMYVAELMDLNAFDQPNVELYKIKTREILGL